MRVIAGEARGRSLEALPGTDVTRPTLSQVKEAMFSIVQFDLPGARVLDLYAGSGQLGIEALSRGAARCVFLDENREAVNIIMRNCKACGVFDRSRVNIGEAARYLSACREQDIPQIREALASIAYWLSRQGKRNEQDGSQYISEFIHFAPSLSVVHDYLLTQLQKHIDSISNLDNKSRIVLEVEQYITQNYDKELSIREIAQRVFVTPNYLCYLYKKNTKRTLNQFILDTKMKKARKLVCETNMKFGEIADALGYANQNYFTRLFTKYFGESPRAYRNKYGSISFSGTEGE